jgi:hypothetical protein
MNSENNLKRNIVHKFQKIIFIFFLTIAFILATPANAYERPQFKDGLTDSWHPGAYCIPCHYTLLGTDNARSISNGCTCHDYKPKNAQGLKVDMTRIFDIHKDIVCIKCHVGNKDGDAVKAADFHRIMSNVSCLSCHTFMNDTYQRPQKTKCSDCHGGDPHVVHGKRLEKMCVACHGEFGETYAGQKLSIPSAPKPQAAASVEYTTIGQVISKIIDSLLQIIR